MTRFKVVRALVITLALPSLLAAQRVTGVVRDSMARTPLPGAVVTVTDSAGDVLQQVLTDESGRFSLSAPNPGAQILVRRIGFHPVRIAKVTVDSSLDIRMAPIAFALTAVRVLAASVCGVEDVQNSDAADLWEQARAALLANVVARRTIPAQALVLSYHDSYDADGTHRTRQDLYHSSGRQLRPFGAAAPASVLATMGYVLDEDQSRVYMAPDADVLLDPRFSATHCFGLTSDDQGHPGQLGLTFRPASNAKKHIVDVAGTLWLDAAHPELKSLAFHYVNLERSAERAGAGGELTFATMPNGVVVLTRWTLTAPVVRQQRSEFDPSRVLGIGVTEVDRLGGVLAHATWPDGVTWRAPLGTLRGVAMRGDPPQPAPGIQVTLDGTDYATQSDSSGAFQFTDVLPGTYTLRLHDAQLAGFGVEPDVEAVVNVAAGQNAVHPGVLASVAAIRAKACGEGKMAAESALLFGRLVADDEPVSWAADVVLTWPEHGTSSVARQHLAADAEGRFWVCGVPRGRVLSVHAERKGSVVLDTVVTTGDTSTDARTFSAHVASAQSPTGTIIGYVSDSAGAAIADADILGRGVAPARSDAQGNFIIRAVPAGRAVLAIRKIGYLPQAVAVTVPAGGSASAPIVLAHSVQVLQTVVTRPDTLVTPSYHGSHKFDLFYQRRRNSVGGIFFTRDALEQRMPARLSDLLQGPALHPPSCALSNPPRDYSLFLDDIPYNTGGLSPRDALDAIPADQVEGMEVYTSPSTLPMEAVGNSCAAIFIWLRGAEADTDSGGGK